MLNSRERETLHEIRHQFLAEKRSPARPFSTMSGRWPHDRGRPVYTTAILVTTVLFVLLVGPKVLTEKEIRARLSSRPPQRHTSSVAA